jgi:hypothetical protein
MFRFRALFLLLAIRFADGQNQQDQQAKPDSLAALRQTAEKTTADWNTLAKGLEQKIARLLPCDPAGRAAVDEVSRASAARLAALSAYVKAEAAAAKETTETVKRVLSAQSSLGGGWTAEHAEADQEHTALEAQIAELKESMRKRGSLHDAEQVLIEISRKVKERAAKAEEQANRKDIVNNLLGDLLAASQQRQIALESEAAQLEVESGRWSSYYAARVTRATTECSIINGPAPRRKTP